MSFEMKEVLDLVREELEPRIGNMSVFKAEDVNSDISEEDIDDHLNESFTHEELGNFKRENFKLVMAAPGTYKYKASYMPFVQIYEQRFGLSDENEMRIYFMPELERVKLEDVLFERYEKAIHKIWEYWENYSKKRVEAK